MKNTETKKLITALVVLLLAGVLCVIMLHINGIIDFTPEYRPDYSRKSYDVGEFGTAEKAEGKTVVVSVFVEDRYTSWQGEEEFAQLQLSYMNMGMEWIEQQAQKYGKTMEFICDWNEFPELKYVLETEDSLSNQGDIQKGGEDIVWDFIDKQVKSAELTEKFGAENIVYYVICNSLEGCAASTNAVDGYFHPDFGYETVYIYTIYFDQEVTPAVYAHEMLHLFGSPDLYATDWSGENYDITQEYVDYCYENRPNDIMLTTYDHDTGERYFDSIPREVTDITAYYIGWLSEAPQEVLDFGLERSQYDPLREEEISSEN
ncbi:MAG: hypothetical protein IJO91_03345 [Oscillospiraceae bacterium]|nr:hypothetical protein [Oscillospiraceae bacterium]